MDELAPDKEPEAEVVVWEPLEVAAAEVAPLKVTPEVAEVVEELAEAPLVFATGAPELADVFDVAPVALSFSGRVAEF